MWRFIKIFFYLLVIITEIFAVIDNRGDTIPDQPRRSIPPGYVEYDGHYYKLIRNGTTWEIARETCERDDGHLAIINSSGEANFIQQLVIQISPDDGESYYPGAWVGFRDINGRSDWRTLDNQTLAEAGYNRWWTSRDKIKRRQCGAIKICGRFAARPCSHHLAFVCEIMFTAAPKVHS